MTGLHEEKVHFLRTGIESVVPWRIDRIDARRRAGGESGIAA